LNNTPAISITLTGTTTYKQFKNSLGDFVYKINQIYLYSLNLNQINRGFKYMKYDSDGNQDFQTIISAIDPYQQQNSIYLNTKEKGLIVNGRNSANFNMLPNTRLSFKIYIRKVTNQDELVGEDNFEFFQDVATDPNFFEEYKDYI
jgi:hypothetical protein